MEKITDESQKVWDIVDQINGFKISYPGFRKKNENEKLKKYI